ncbi:unnamed protein product [Vitrella brassicaformis CCMP3155]|uniref:Uncharacterized protein n=1 Tax=Vitrella brassicaformis (strain CCMP3155) TaxID=1169540 RepID=A0A0G4FMN0_VITBC|nr:unnamed protein product [Vitrella brassicaformis CCMP3155]|eukprot:CEM15327.1 unnamed protein product [Vitrella brassicaformis CCMP3155]
MRLFFVFAFTAAASALRSSTLDTHRSDPSPSLALYAATRYPGRPDAVYTRSAAILEGILSRLQSRRYLSYAQTVQVARECVRDNPCLRILGNAPHRYDKTAQARRLTDPEKREVADLLKQILSRLMQHTYMEEFAAETDTPKHTVKQLREVLSVIMAP